MKRFLRRLYANAVLAPIGHLFYRAFRLGRRFDLSRAAVRDIDRPSMAYSAGLALAAIAQAKRKTPLVFIGVRVEVRDGKVGIALHLPAGYIPRSDARWILEEAARVANRVPDAFFAPDEGESK